MDNEQPSSPLSHRVLDRIKGGGVAMRPRWHFVLRAVLFVAGLAIVTLTLLFIASFVVFALQATGLLYVPAFGLEGWGELFWSLPWLLILLTLLFIILLEILVRHYAFAYRRPLLYSALAVIIVAVVGGTFLAPLHRSLLDRADRNELPFVGGFYRAFGEPQFRNVHVGDVTVFVSQGFMMQTRRGENLTVVVSPETRFPYGSDIELGDHVVVFGQRDDDTIQALGVQRIDFNDRLYGPSSPNPTMVPLHLPPPITPPSP